MAGLLADNVSSWDIVWKHYLAKQQSFKGKCEILRTISQPRTLWHVWKWFICFISLPWIFILWVDSKCCWLFCSLQSSIWDKFFNVTTNGHNENILFSFHVKQQRWKQWNSQAGYFPLAWFLYKRDNWGTKISVEGGYCVIIVQWFCTIWH